MNKPMHFKFSSPVAGRADLFVDKRQGFLNKENAYGDEFTVIAFVDPKTITLKQLQTLSCEAKDSGVEMNLC